MTLNKYEVHRISYDEQLNLLSELIYKYTSTYEVYRYRYIVFGTSLGRVVIVTMPIQLDEERENFLALRCCTDGGTWQLICGFPCCSSRIPQFLLQQTKEKQRLVFIIFSCAQTTSKSWAERGWGGIRWFLFFSFRVHTSIARPGFTVMLQSLYNLTYLLLLLLLYLFEFGKKKALTKTSVRSVLPLVFKKNTTYKIMTAWANTRPI